MTQKYTYFRDQRVSVEHNVLLTAAVRAGVDFDLNDGARSMREQQSQVDRKGVWSPSNPHGAARPSRTAPHIKEGHANHALDVDTARRGNVNLANFYRQQGVPVVFNVPTEAWHMDPTNEKALKNAARRLQRFSRSDLSPKERSLTRELLRLRASKRDVHRRSQIKAWLRARANVLLDDKHKNIPKNRQRAEYLRDIAFNRPTD